MMYKKILILLFCFLQLHSFGQTSLIDTLLSVDEINWLNKNKENIKYAPNPSWGVGDYIDENGIHQGIVSDYIKIFESKLGVSFKKVLFENWNNMYNALIDTRADFVGAIQKTEEREDYLVFTEEFLVVPLVILVRNDYPHDFSQSQISRMKLTGVIGYSNLEYIKKTYPQTNLVECKDDLSALLQTSLGSTDGTITDMISASYLVEKYGINNLRFGLELDFTWHLRFACRKELPELCSILDKLLKTIDENQRKEIYNRWVNTNSISSPNFFEKNLKAILYVATIFLFFFILILSFNVRLKRKVRSKTIELKSELVEKERVVTLLQKNESRLKSLFEIYKRKTESIKELFDFALSEAIKLTESKFGLLYQFNQEAQSFSISNSLIITNNSEGKTEFKENFLLDDLGICSVIIRNKTVFLTQNRCNCNYSKKKKCPISSLELNNLLGIPIMNGDDITAVLFLANKETEYEKADTKQMVLLMNSVWELLSKQQWQERLINALEKAEESDRLKSAFLQNMSHEIRTPMNGIIGFSELLKNPNLSSDDQKRFIDIIGESGERMLRTINNIMDISKIEAGLMRVYISKSDINKQIEFLHKFFAPVAESKGLQLSFNLGLPSNEAIINTDDEKISSILTNLVGNAIKFTIEGSIDFGYEKKRQYLEFYVKDTGIGIPEDRLDAIFERFIMADIEDKRAFQGSGLGLTISKSYVEMLDGKMWVESEEGLGSIFYFTIPCNAFSEEKAKIKSAVLSEVKEGMKKKLKILIVEDDEISFSLLTGNLQKISKEVLHAVTGIEAVESCRSNPDIDLVLMDIRTPVMDGYEATRQIRLFNTEVIIIAQTAYGLIGDREKAIEAGCNDYISKPIDMTLLNELIKKHCNK